METRKRKASPTSAVLPYRADENSPGSKGKSETPDTALRRSGRTRNNGSDFDTPKVDPIEFLMKPMTQDERQDWKGWCEVESEPAFFNVMLREFGVEGVKVQEIISLDEEMLSYIFKPVYGLVFLFQFKEDDTGKQVANCPRHVWFANQTTSNSCASVALLNILMNVNGVHLGPALEAFKDHTKEMTPPMRGESIGSFDFVRNIHNSFARKMDMLNADLFLSNDSSAKKTSTKTKATTTTKAKSKAKKIAEEEANGFHFIAFVPIGKHLWKLDGLERQPVDLGEYEGDWVSLARPMIEERMQQYEGDQIHFSLISLCKSPLLSIPASLATNITTLSCISQRLDSLKPDWKSFVPINDVESLLVGPDSNYVLTQELLDEARQGLGEKVFKGLEGDEQAVVAELCNRYAELAEEQGRLKTAYVDQSAESARDQERAAGRRHDYSPLIHRWVTLLAEKGVLGDLVDKSGADR